MIDLNSYKPNSSTDWRYLDRFFALLSEEKITVIRGNFRTASMDITNRVIRIPTFAFENKDVALLMGSHEVAHALYTPDLYSHENVKNIKNKTLGMCLNIVEDIRIERLIRKKYQGFVAVYERGYKELLKNKFFGVESYAEFNIADKVNLAAKLGRLNPHKLTVQEDCIRRYVSDTANPEDVVKKSLYLYKLLKLENEGTDINELIKDLLDKLGAGDILEGSGEAGGGEPLDLEGLSDELREKLEKALENAADKSKPGTFESESDEKQQSHIESKTEQALDDSRQNASLKDSDVIGTFPKIVNIPRVAKRPVFT